MTYVVSDNNEEAEAIEKELLNMPPLNSVMAGKLLSIPILFVYIWFKPHIYLTNGIIRLTSCVV